MRPTNISGISESRVAPVAAYIGREKSGQGLILVSSMERAKRLAIDLSFFVSENVYIMPDEDAFLRYEARSHEQLYKRMSILKAMVSGEKCVVIATPQSIMRVLPPRRIYEEAAITITRGQCINIEEIKKDLIRMGYERVGLTDSRGQFAVRGDIVDVFTPDNDHPYRIEVFGDEVDSIRTFDSDNQRSIENIKYATIYPALQILKDEVLFEQAALKLKKEYGAQIRKLERYEDKEHKKAAENLKVRRDQISEYIENSTNIQLLENYMHYFYEERQFLWDYLAEDSYIAVDDPGRIHELLSLGIKEHKETFADMLERGFVVPKDHVAFASSAEFMDIYSRNNVYVFTAFASPVKGIPEYKAIHSIRSKQGPVFNGRMDMLAEEVKAYIKAGYKVTIVCSSKERFNSLGDFLEAENIKGKIYLQEGNITSGMEFPDEKICYISDGDIFPSRKKSRPKTKKSEKARQRQNFSDLKKGDFVVHEKHGIGKFLGIEQLLVEGQKQDYLKIKYAGEDKLYVPVEQMDIVQRYIGGDTASVRLNKLSGGEWKATKAKAKAAIANMAQELIEISAARMKEEGYPFAKDTVWQAEFEDSFPYNETEDQRRCAEEIKKDMERAVAMDRLLCGDVGYGKTEVAARAMFKCAADGKQVAVLVPTTLLANQHFYNLKERFEKFPFKAEMLSRFRDEKQQNEILRQVKNGSIDVIIGTHRLLSKDVEFKDLGLLVIDEEQRFGVQHKEIIKQLKHNVDVLTLSATPIPRTLHMSLVGIKDMSLIEEPPEERYPIQTYVMEQDEPFMRDIILREIGRGGQVYLVYNRVRGIYKIASMIEELVPEAKVAVGHGQMNEHMLEKVMLDFVNGETNVLITTTIIETGIDVPNVNTIIILDADRFGLSQLYQLRGRVGRSTKMAYAYLMYQKDKVLTEIAEKRLKAIKDFTEFGAGFKIAMRDLELRGAGNILGTEQHGHMMNVGYELYCKLVDDAVRALRGEVVNPDSEEASIEIKLQAYIPDSYIPDEVLKLRMYKSIALATSEEDEADLIDELMDRFGEMPQETENLVKISVIRAMAEKLCITRIYEDRNKLIFQFAEKSNLTARNLSELSGEYGGRVLIHAGKVPIIKYNVEKDKLSECQKILKLLSDTSM